MVDDDFFFTENTDIGHSLEAALATGIYWTLHIRTHGLLGADIVAGSLFEQGRGIFRFGLFTYTLDLSFQLGS